jgi:hypothetical protein
MPDYGHDIEFGYVVAEPVGEAGRFEHALRVAGVRV